MKLMFGLSPDFITRSRLATVKPQIQTLTFRTFEIHQLRANQGVVGCIYLSYTIENTANQKARNLLHILRYATGNYSTKQSWRS